MFPKKLQEKLDQRTSDNALRAVGQATSGIDFSSNDYLGFSASKKIFNRSIALLKEHQVAMNGATGSRLLSGNHALYAVAETHIASFHNTEKALLFNSGYDANVGFFGSVPQRGDIILYDELCHASIRDGITMSHAKAFKFKHNNIAEVEASAKRHASFNPEHPPEIYIVTEAVFSMDGDLAPIKQLAAFCTEKGYHLIIDEAHAVGVIGEHGEGLVQSLGLEDQVFARLITFGKALGCHGAAIVCNEPLQQYLINFARSFIYTTALPPHSVATIIAAYEKLQDDAQEQTKLKSNIAILHSIIAELKLTDVFIPSESAIQCCLIKGNIAVKKVAHQLQKRGFEVKPILSPTVAKGQERLRICLHSFNTETEIRQVAALLAKEILI